MGISFGNKEVEKRYRIDSNLFSNFLKTCQGTHQLNERERERERESSRERERERVLHL
jgi:hypothetical protein